MTVFSCSPPPAGATEENLGTLKQQGTYTKRSLTAPRAAPCHPLAAGTFPDNGAPVHGQVKTSSGLSEGLCVCGGFSLYPAVGVLSERGSHKSRSSATSELSHLRN